MKNSLSICILLCILSLPVLSQYHYIDSLRQVAATGKKDTVTCMAIYRVGLWQYKEARNIDSAMWYAQQGLAMAAAAHWTVIEASHHNLIGNMYFFTGTYNKSLEAYLACLKLTDETVNQRSAAVILNNIGSVYALLGDYPKSTEYSYRSKAIAEKLASPESLVSCLINLGDSYYRMRQYDSARALGEKAYSIASKNHFTEAEGLALGNLGQAYSATGSPEIAIGYFRKALNILGDYTASTEVYLSLAKAFQQMGQPDSALYYGRRSFERALSLEMRAEQLAASTFMADHYKRSEKVDSAYRYLNYIIEAKDSLFSQEKTRQVEALSLEETVRQQKLEQARLNTAEERSHNIQYAIMAVGVVCFLVIILLLSRSVIVGEQWIRFLGVLGLLLLFEFINLFIHPVLGDLTHHSPFLMFVALVIIAAILIPVHHKVEHYILHRLTVKNRKIRLEAARRTIAELEQQEGSATD